jgi:hypothetical protein
MAGINFISNGFNLKNMPNNSYKDEMKSNLVQWLMEEGYKTSEETDPNAIYRIVVENPHGIKVVVIRPINTIDKIAIASGVVIIEEHRKKLRDMENAKKLSFLWDLRFALLEEKVDFGGIDLDPKGINFSTIIYFDEIKKSSFMKKISDMQRIVTFLLWKYSREFGEPAPTESPAYV